MNNKLNNLLYEKNIFIKRHYAHMRKKLINLSPSFLCPNCLGGILFHNLGLQFRSPTVNLMIYSNDFVKFILNLDEYINGTFSFFESKDYSCPCAHLVPRCGGEPITVHFTHYRSQQEALQKWNERILRIDRKNLFIFLPERDGVTEQQLRSLSKISVRGLVVFTVNRYDLPYTVQIPKSKKTGEMKNLLKRNCLTGIRNYERYFDFVKWFNEADGGDFDVSAFIK